MSSRKILSARSPLATREASSACFFSIRKSGIGAPRPWRRPAGARASPARLSQPVLCRSTVLSAVPCNARLPWTPLRHQSRTGVPCVSRLCELICTSRAIQPLPPCVVPSPCRRFPLHTTPSLAHPHKGKGVDCFAISASYCWQKWRRVEGAPALRGTKNCHSPRPLSIFAPTQGVFRLHGAPP